MEAAPRPLHARAAPALDREPPHARAPTEEAQLDRAGRALGDVFHEDKPSRAAYGLALASAALDLLVHRRKR